MKTEERKWLTDFFENSLDIPKQKEIAQRLINRAVEMQPVYSELNKKLYSPSQKQCVMLAIIDMAILYGENIRDEMRLLNEKKEEIAMIANKLCRLIEDYKNNENRFGPCIPNLFELINNAGSNYSYYDLQMRDKIDKIRSDDFRFLGYAPDIEDILRTLANSLYEKDSEPNYPEDRAALQSQKFSHFDFIRALWKRLELSNECYGSLLPRGFRLSHEAIGAVAMCALDLNFDVSADDVKKAIKSIKPVFA
jgi:hypothetical protein